jgi:uncharacterized protein with HEPN domain
VDWVIAGTIKEALKKIPEVIRTESPEVPWRNNCGPEGHWYPCEFGVNENTIWDVVENKLVPLHEVILMLLKELPRES